MTAPTEAVELLARALFDARHSAYDGMSVYRTDATALLARLAPMLTADAIAAERAACTEELRLAVAAEREKALREAASACQRIAGNTKDFHADHRRAAGQCAAMVLALIDVKEGGEC